MRCVILFFVLGAILPGAAVAQEEARHAPATYVVQLTEFQMRSPPGPALTAEEIVQSFIEAEDDERFQVVETIRLSALSGRESMVQFGKQVTVTVGFSQRGPDGPRMRQARTAEVGTMVQLTAEPEAGKILIDLSYQSSRLVGEGTDDSPPDTATVQITCAQLVELEKPILVGGTSAGDTSFLMMSVTQ